MSLNDCHVLGVYQIREEAKWKSEERAMTWKEMVSDFLDTVSG